MVSIKHKFQSNKGDSEDDTLIQPSDWNDDHEITVSKSGVLLGRSAAGPGSVQELTDEQVKELLNLALSDVSGLGVLAGVDEADTQHIKNDAVTNAKLADMEPGTLKGRNAGLQTGNPQDLSVAQVRSMLGLGAMAYEDSVTTETISGNLGVEVGGTGASTAAGARQNLAAAGYSTTGNVNQTNFPVGTVLYVLGAYRRRETTTIYLHPNDDRLYTTHNSGGSALAGTWRSCGYGDDFTLFQRVA